MTSGNNRRVAGKVAIVTGGASGMGASHARTLVEHGARVAIADVDDVKGRALADDLGDNALFCHLDVADPSQWAGLIDIVHERFGKVTTLVNNAGILILHAVDTATHDDYRKVVDIDQFGPFLGMQAVIPDMKELGGGSIVNISSTAGIVGFANNFAYTAAKWAVRGMTKAAALDLAGFGIRVNNIMPGEVHTGMIEGLDLDVSETPIGRFGDPKDISYLVLYLASDESSYTTGADHVIDGGYTIH
jgi:3alpha(or 20beta)-hydroxysteroid dehydrogenase